MNSRSPKFTNTSLIFAYLLKRSGHEMIKAFASVGTVDCECFYLVQYNVIMILNIICALVCVCVCVFCYFWSCGKKFKNIRKKLLQSLISQCISYQISWKRSSGLKFTYKVDWIWISISYDFLGADFCHGAHSIIWSVIDEFIVKKLPLLRYF